MKKVLSALLTLALALALSVPAFAADKADKKDKAPKSSHHHHQTEVSIPKPPRPEAPAINVTAEEAEQTALDEAGLQSWQVKGLHSYKLYEQGSACAYRVQFARYDRALRQTSVYTIDIDVTDGSVTASRCDIH